LQGCGGWHLFQARRFRWPHFNDQGDVIGINFAMVSDFDGPNVKLRAMLPTQYKMLYPVDFSKRSTLAIQHVKVWVEHFRAPLDTLYIINHASGSSTTNRKLPAMARKPASAHLRDS
jgi:hypothetical protein